MNATRIDANLPSSSSPRHRLIILSQVGAGLQETTSAHPLPSLSSGNGTGGMMKYSFPSAPADGTTPGKTTNPSESQTTSSRSMYCFDVCGNTSVPMSCPSSARSRTVGSGGGRKRGSFTMQMTFSRSRARLNPSLTTSMPPVAFTVASSSLIISMMPLSR